MRGRRREKGLGRMRMRDGERVREGQKEKEEKGGIHTNPTGCRNITILLDCNVLDTRIWTGRIIAVINID